MIRRLGPILKRLFALVERKPEFTRNELQAQKDRFANL
jgi:hypothetical protein